jgi:hypothetical protein
MGKLFSQLVGLIAGLLFAYFYQKLSNLNQSSNQFSSIEQAVIGSWKKYVHLPDRKLNRAFRIAIG